MLVRVSCGKRRVSRQTEIILDLIEELRRTPRQGEPSLGEPERCREQRLAQNLEEGSTRT